MQGFLLESFCCYHSLQKAFVHKEYNLFSYFFLGKQSGASYYCAYFFICMINYVDDKPCLINHVSSLQSLNRKGKVGTTHRT